MTQNSAFKKRVRERMRVTGEKYTEARRKILSERSEREAAVEAATGVRRSELEALGFLARPTAADIQSDGWVVKAPITHLKLVPFNVYPAGDHAVVTGRKEQ